MKKIALCLSIIAMSLVSCSDSDSDSDSNPNGPNDPSAVLVKKVVYSSVDYNFTETINYTYNGNKLVKGVYTDGAEEIYTYSGDLITKMELIEDGEVVVQELYAYDNNGRLTQYNYVEEGNDQQETFVYNNDGTVTSTLGIGNDLYTRTIYFANNEILKIVDESGATYTFTYDGKNSPYRNVTEYDKIAFATQGDHYFFGRQQNVVLIQETVEGEESQANMMTYNSNNYPTTATSVQTIFGETYTASMQYTYN